MIDNCQLCVLFALLSEYEIEADFKKINYVIYLTYNALI